MRNPAQIAETKEKIAIPYFFIASDLSLSMI